MEENSERTIFGDIEEQEVKTPEYIYQNGVDYENEGNYEDALHCFKSAALLGHTYSHYKAGILYEKKLCYYDAYDSYKKAAAESHVEAQIALGILYHKGYGVPQDLEKAKSLYRSASTDKPAEAYLNIGIIFREENDYEQAIENFRAAADHDCAQAYFELGVLYEKGNGIPIDYNQALANYEAAATMGYVKAYVNIGSLYENGCGVGKSESNASEYYLKAASKGDLLGMKNLARHSLKLQDYSDSFHWYKKAASKGDSEALYYVALHYQKGFTNSQRPDIDTALDIYRQVIEKRGYLKAYKNAGDCLKYRGEIKNAMQMYEEAAAVQDSEAIYELGMIYKNKKDYLKARYYFEQATNLDDENSIYEMGLLYLQGKTGEKDYEKAKELFLKIKDHILPMFQLAYMIDEGLIKEIPGVNIMECFKKAAKGGDPVAQYKLGLKYKYDPTEKNELKENYWLKKSAENGNPDACYELGLMYLKRQNFGNGTDNLDTAKIYFRKAIKFNHPDAYYQLAILHKEESGEPFHYTKVSITNFKEAAKLGHVLSQRELGLYYFNEKDYKNSFKYFNQASNKDDIISQYHLGSMFQNGFGTDRNYSNALRMYTAAAIAEYVPSIFKVGLFYHLGYGVLEIDIEMAAIWYKKAAEKNDKMAQNNLGMYYREKKNHQKALYWFKKASEKNFGKSQYLLARMYLEELSTEKNSRELAKEWLIKAASDESGKYIDAILLLADLYDSEKNFAAAFEWYEKAAMEDSAEGYYKQGMYYFWNKVISDHDNVMRANSRFAKAFAKGYSDAAFQLGYIYQEGLLDGKKEFEKARDLYEKAYEGGNIKSCVKLGYIYEQGDHSLPQNKDMALAWYLKAAEHDDSTAQYRAGMLYMKEQKDKNKCLEWLLKAANNENKHAQYEIGLHYDFEKTYKDALFWFTKAAEKHHRKAQIFVGNYYRNGFGTETDFVKALEWYKKAADQDDEIAHYYIGILHKEGRRGIQQNYNKALESFRRGEAKNEINSICEIGELYFEGKGVEKNIVSAEKYFYKASDKNNPNADYFLGLINQDGLNGASNEKEAMKHFESAANRGHTLAQYNMGMYYVKRGTAGDINMAIGWFEQSAKKNHPESLFEIGKIYYDRRYPFKNDQKAFDNFRKSAILGHAESQFCTGYFYYNTSIIKKQPYVALKWFISARNNRFYEAISQINRIKQDLDISEKSEDGEYFQESYGLLNYLNYHNIHTDIHWNSSYLSNTFDFDEMETKSFYETNHQIDEFINFVPTYTSYPVTPETDHEEPWELKLKNSLFLDKKLDEPSDQDPHKISNFYLPPTQVFDKELFIVNQESDEDSVYVG